MEEPQKQPFVRLELRLKAGASALKATDVEPFDMTLWRVANENGNHSAQSNEVIGSLSLQGDLRAGGPVLVQGASLPWFSARPSCAGS